MSRATSGKSGALRAISGSSSSSWWRVRAPNCSDPLSTRTPASGNVDVHDQAGPGEPIVEERHEALPPGQDLGLRAVLAEQREGFGQRLRCRVLERMHAS